MYHKIISNEIGRLNSLQIEPPCKTQKAPPKQSLLYIEIYPVTLENFPQGKFSVCGKLNNNSHYTICRTGYLLEFLHWRFTAFYIVRNAHIVGYCGGVIAYRLIFWVLPHRMLHQISTKPTPRLTPVLFDKLEFVKCFLLGAVQYILLFR